jgi:hypothetical protein
MLEELGGSSPGPGRRNLSRLLRDLAEDAITLLRQEIALVRAEAVAAWRRLTMGLGRMAAGGVVMMVGSLVLVVFLIAGLGALLSDMYWLSALLVGLALILGGIGIVLVGLRRLEDVGFVPEHSTRSTRETVGWLGREWRGISATLRGRSAGVEARGLGPGDPVGLLPGAASLGADEPTRTPTRAGSAPGRPEIPVAPPAEPLSAAPTPTRQRRTHLAE